MSFIEAIDNQGRVILGQWVPRARLGLHIKLSKISEKISQALIDSDGKAAARLISAYFSEVGLNVREVGGMAQLTTYLELFEMNSPAWLLAYQKWEAPPGKPKAYDYPGREWAWVIHKIASRYGWTREEIFNLWPEEAAAYLQEIFITEYDESDEARALSEMGWHYDKHTKRSTFRPLPRPGWMVEKPEEKKIRIRKDMLPVGHIIKLGNVRPEDVTLH